MVFLKQLHTGIPVTLDEFYLLLRWSEEGQVYAVAYKDEEDLLEIMNSMYNIISAIIPSGDGKKLILTNGCVVLATRSFNEGIALAVLKDNLYSICYKM